MAKTETVKLTYECRACSGTGLYCGFCEAKHEAVVCVRCGGKGYLVEEFKIFPRRKKRKGIKRIRFGSGLFIDTPGKESWFTYKEFEKLIPATKK